MYVYTNPSFLLLKLWCVMEGGKYLNKPIRMKGLSHCLQKYIKMRLMTHVLLHFAGERQLLTINDQQH